MVNNWDTQLIDHVVREVIRRLMDRGVAVAEESESASDKEIVMKDKVITLATLEGRLGGIRRVVVGRRAVVTPAVRDELNDRRVELLRR